MFYPIHSKLRKLSPTFSSGNFGLWFNKLIPLTCPEKCRACDLRGEPNNAIQYYYEKYKLLKRDRNVEELLKSKHLYQQEYCESLEKAGFTALKLPAVLVSPLILGIGQPHPSEVGMLFDYTMGIPYVPSSSIKGIVRFARALELITESGSKFVKKDKRGEYLDDSIKETLIPDIFGGLLTAGSDGETKIIRGKVVFLDAYPDKVPDLHVDIMNPHYGEYYADELGRVPPADYLSPNPIKFLTVKPGSKFIFRAIVKGVNRKELEGKVRSAFKNALEVEGIGAKTAIGYGRFKLMENDSIQGTKVIENKVTPSETEVIWEGASLSWTPQNQTLTATCSEEKLRATMVGKDNVFKVVPQKYHKRLFEKHKSVRAKVEIEKWGKLCKIVKVE